MTYPNAIQFSSEHSVNNQGLLDLTLSYNNKVIAQKRNNLTVGNKVLICNREKGRGMHDSWRSSHEHRWCARQTPEKRS